MVTTYNWAYNPAYNRAFSVIARKRGPVRTRKPGPVIPSTGATINE